MTLKLDLPGSNVRISHKYSLGKCSVLTFIGFCCFSVLTLGRAWEYAQARSTDRGGPLRFRSESLPIRSYQVDQGT